ncbi:MAG TPA: sigma-54-dependent Fis family transcriptional regulator [Kofleriaceae bacterium]|nr:sigma-54-dependent Fis family transcriptional regulator [Kofleriaceae bacterium]
MAVDREETAAAAERDFYRRLLDLSSAAEPEPLLAEALAAIVGFSGAQIAYLELHDPADPDPAAPGYWKAHGWSDAELAQVRSVISRSIIASTMSAGRMVSTPAAVADPSFRQKASVARHEIQAVLCAPIGRPAIGALYLQANQASDQFLLQNQGAVEVFARQLAIVADRLLASREPREQADATRTVRQRFRCEGIVGRSPALARVLEDAAAAAPSRTTVLITGPAGTGKSALARTIHANSPRAMRPCIEVNCAAIPEGLFESELFGAEAGAASGITRRITGRVAAARGGTLFLDEIGELPLATQAKLLQLLQDRVYFPLGTSEPVKADVRVISATNADLLARVAERKFREDLYYRLAVLPIAMPGLEERRDDIPVLVEWLCTELCSDAERPMVTITRRALQACREADWPGQIRQLRNAIEAALARIGEGDTLDEHHIFPAAPRADGAPFTYREAMQRAQRRLLEEALERNEWNISRTALELDLNRQHLHELMGSLKIRRPGK